MFQRFMRKIERNPWCQETRLIFADWLDELGSDAAWGMRLLATVAPQAQIDGWAMFAFGEKYASSVVWKCAYQAWINPFTMSNTSPEMNVSRNDEHRELTVMVTFEKIVFAVAISDRELLSVRGDRKVWELAWSKVIEMHRGSIVNVIAESYGYELRDEQAKA